MPGLVEADDDGLYVLKFRGAGQGPRALVAEVIAASSRAPSGCRCPSSCSSSSTPSSARAEPDPEIQELICASGGLNLGVDFLPGALAFTPARARAPDPELAADVVWLDALLTNVDRTPRNPNLLVWHGRAVADRPRRGALPPARRARPAEHGDPRLPRDRRPRAAAASPGSIARGRRAPGAAASTARALETRRRAGARATGSAATAAGTYVDYLDERLRPRGRSRRRRSVPGARSPFHTRSCASSRASSAASASTSASSSSAANASSSPSRTFLDERRLAALAADVAARGGSRAPGRAGAHRRGRGRRRADRRASAGAAIRLARLAVEHDRAAVRGALRALR